MRHQNLKTLMLLSTTLLIISSCAGSPQRPDADICGINFASDSAPHLHCFNILKDYTSSGVLKSGAKPHDKLIAVPSALNAGKYVSKEDWPKIQVWLQDLRDYAKNKCN